MPNKQLTDMSYINKLLGSEKGKRLYRQEATILTVTELMCETMDKEGISRTELARRLNKSTKWVYRLLDGDINLDIRLISDVFYAMGKEMTFTLSDLEKSDEERI